MAKQVTLSFREYQVGMLIARGMTEKEIARELGLLSAVGNYREHINQKLGTHSPSQVALAFLSPDVIFHVSGRPGQPGRAAAHMPMSEIVVDVKDPRAEAEALYEKLVWSDDPVDQLRADALARVIKRMPGGGSVG